MKESDERMPHPYYDDVFGPEFDGPLLLGLLPEIHAIKQEQAALTSHLEQLIDSLPRTTPDDVRAIAQNALDSYGNINALYTVMDVQIVNKFNAVNQPSLTPMASHQGGLPGFPRVSIGGE